MAYIAKKTNLLPAGEMLKHIPLAAGARVGDLGCGGHGLFALAAARLIGPRGVVYAVDILKTTLAEVAQKARLDGVANIKPIWSNLEIVGATAIPPQSLDAVLLISVLFQCHDRPSVLTEAKRLLKPGGALLVVDWKTTATALGPAAQHRIAPPAMHALVTAAGFVAGEQFDAGPYHYGMVFTKS